MDRNTRTQLRLLSEIADILAHAHIRFWLRGGWALDFHLGRITREHSDIDLVARYRQRSRIRKVLEATGYRVTAVGELESIQFQKLGQEIGLAFIWSDELERALSAGPRSSFADAGLRWPEDAFRGRRYQLKGVACRVMSVESSLAEKENYERYIGRQLRPKDLNSIKLLRAVRRGTR